MFESPTPVIVRFMSAGPALQVPWSCRGEFLACRRAGSAGAPDWRLAGWCLGLLLLWPVRSSSHGTAGGVSKGWCQCGRSRSCCLGRRWTFCGKKRDTEIAGPCSTMHDSVLCQWSVRTRTKSCAPGTYLNDSNLPSHAEVVSLRLTWGTTFWK